MIEVENSADDDKFGAWRLFGGDFEILDRGSPRQQIVYVPTEDVALFVVDLPLASRSQRLAAAPFAIEDRLAQPLEDVHVALGAELAPRRHIVGAVALDQMAAWMARTDGFGLSRAIITPDVFLLPRPPEDQWIVEVRGSRALVRTSDGAGFAIAAGLLAEAWRAAGQPRIAGARGALPDPLVVDPASLALETVAGAAPLDLRQGRFALRRPEGGRLFSRIAAILILGLAAHVAIAAVNVAALKRTAARRHAEAYALLSQASPGLAATEDLATALDDVLPSASAGKPGPMIPLLVSTSVALEPMGSSVNLRSLSFEDRALGIKVEAADLPTLQRVEGALAAGGLAASRGGATSEAGRATGEFSVRLPEGQIR